VFTLKRVKGWSGWSFLADSLAVTSQATVDCIPAVRCFTLSLSGSCEIWQRAASQTHTLGGTDTEKKKKQEREAKERCKTNVCFSCYWTQHPNARVGLRQRVIKEWASSQEVFTQITKYLLALMSFHCGIYYWRIYILTFLFFYIRWHSFTHQRAKTYLF